MSLVERTLKKLEEARASGRGEKPRTAAAPSAPAREPRSSAQPTAPKAERVPVPVGTTRVVSIDRAALRRMHVLSPPDMERRIASQYQQIKRPIVASVLNPTPELGPASHTVMLASALSGDGKTYVSINLALSLAMERDIEILLVDADIPKPHVTQIFGLENEPGLMDLLLDNSLHANQLILRTDVPGLSILPAGRHVENATELLSSERMADVMAQFAAADGRRIALLDSPPLLLSTESRAIAANAGQVVMVVRADVTSRQAVNDAVAAVGAEKMISLVLNQVSSQPTSGYYGYGNFGEANAPPP